LEALVHHPKVLAWGEIGLDFYYDHSPRDVQQQAFVAQLQRAIQCDVPVVIHTREAERATLDLLQDYPVPRSGHVHCFTGTPAMAEQLLAMGFYIGFTGIVSFPKADNVRAAVRVVPLERLLIETDSPYLTPLPYRGRRNEPAFVCHVAEAIAQVKGVSVGDVVHHSTQNFYRLYGKSNMTWELLNAGTIEPCQ
jgi:TatD DNase family protein